MAIRTSNHLHLAAAQRPQRSATVSEVARFFQVGEARVRDLIRKGLLRAIDIGSAAGSRQSLRIPPEALAEFERSVAVKATLKVAGKPLGRPRKPKDEFDDEITKILTLGDDADVADHDDDE